MLLIIYALLMFRAWCLTEGQKFEKKNVTVGEDVKLTCPLESVGSLFWIVLFSEKFPEVLGRSSSPLNDAPRIRTKKERKEFVLYISKAGLTDTAFYFCIKTLQNDFIFLAGTHVIVESSTTTAQPGPEPVVTTTAPSVPVHPGDSVTLQCSVFSDSENKTCPAEDSVFCFSHEPHQSLSIFNRTKVNDSDEYDHNSGGASTKKCFFNFRNFSSSGARTYYCSVAMCGKTLSGNISELNNEGESIWESKKDNAVLYVLCGALVISVIVIVFLLYSIKKLTKKPSELCRDTYAVPLQTVDGNHENQQTDEDSLIYTVPSFTYRKSNKTITRDTKPTEEESIYTDVKVLRLDQHLDDELN
ncbi:uncharacterized protein LOC125008297 [Mugil cephalus]|uniref:uncharacterized protein LOC125008297 n=1 Tax=Mugil cephalus TaxID=48193 RepID=UPI001FB7043A|nr:uncharacterized protein LOC125008297 [Mugil cephalus]